VEEARRTFKESFDARTFEVILNERGMGLGYERIVVSFHKDLTEYTNFRRWMQQMPFINASKLDSFIMDLNYAVHYRSLTFSYTARHILQTLRTETRTDRAITQVKKRKERRIIGAK
jgi:hypothetical protein